MHDDGKILKDLLDDKEKAFDAVFEKYSDFVFGFMLKNCRSAEDAKDLTQETFVKLWRYKQNIAPGTSLKAYLYSVAHSILMNHIRKNVNRKLLESLLNEQEIDMPEQDDKIELENILGKIDAYAQKMPDRRKEVYQLKWIKGLSRKEIAAEMGISTVTVDIHIRKVLEYLKLIASKLDPGS